MEVSGYTVSLPQSPLLRLRLTPELAVACLLSLRSGLSAKDAIRQGQRYEEEDKSLTHKARPREQPWGRASKPTSPVSHEEIVDDDGGENRKCQKQCAYAKPKLGVIKAAIAGH